MDCLYGLFKCKIHGLQLTVRTVQTVGGKGANKRINKKMHGSNRIGCFRTVWVYRIFFDRGYRYYVDCMCKIHGLQLTVRTVQTVGGGGGGK